MRVAEIVTSRMRVSPGEGVQSDTSSQADGFAHAADRSEFRIESFVLAFVGMLCATVLGFLSEMRPLDPNSADRGYDESLGSQSSSIKGVGRNDASGAKAAIVCVNPGPTFNDRLGMAGRGSSEPSIGSPGASRPRRLLSFSSMTGDAP